MVHTYEKTWLMHHHAALKTKDRKAGLSVLNQISWYYNTFHLYDSPEFIISYSRPDNRPPKRVFGGYHKHINKPNCCSVDPFAFLHLKSSGFSDDNKVLSREGIEIYRQAGFVARGAYSVKKAACCRLLFLSSQPGGAEAV